MAGLPALIRLVEMRWTNFLGIYPGDSVWETKTEREREASSGETKKKPRCEATEGNNNRTSEYFWRSLSRCHESSFPAGEQWQPGGWSGEESVAAGRRERE